MNWAPTEANARTTRRAGVLRRLRVQLHDQARHARSVKNPTTHLTFSYATQVVILGDDGKLERVVAAHDVGRAINPMGCAGTDRRRRAHGPGYALSENFTQHQRLFRIR